MGIRLIGDWAIAQTFLRMGPANAMRAVDTAMRRQAEVFRREVIDGIRDQAPGGKRFKPLSRLTLATRLFRRFRGTKALIERGDLRRSIKVHPIHGKGPGGSDGYFVGVHRTEKSRTGDLMVNIAAVQEFGATITIQLHANMRRFLAMMFRRAGLPRPAGSAKAVIVVRIPPRPFLGPVADKLRPTVTRAIVQDIARGMGLGA